MDLEVVGRHALLVDDDATAAFVNSNAALVDWNSLLIDRYDVRHLLASPPPPRKRRSPFNSCPPANSDDVLEAELDVDRYLDLPSPSSSPDLGNRVELVNAGGYNAVHFSYSNTDDSVDQKNNDAELGFHPPFSVPESLLQSLPPNEKVHQIIARTAMFISKHGGQSEIVLRVKHGDNPTFGFLMPDHHLHVYFRFLVDHQELLNGKSLEEGNKADSGFEQTSDTGVGGALSLLGSVYGSGEDEDAAADNAKQNKSSETDEAVNASKTNLSTGSEKIETSRTAAGKHDVLSNHPLASLKEKAPLIRKNNSISAIKGAKSSGIKKGSDLSGLLTVADTSRVPALPSASKIEPPIVEPPSDMKRVVEKIVEFIMKNGKEFEAVLAEQDTKHGRFPFLLPSNLYHPYYRKVLQKAEEAKLPSEGLVNEKHDGMGLGVDKKSGFPKQGESLSFGSDIPYESDRKEKFKMVIGKSKKDGQDPPSKSTQPEFGVNVDAAAAAAILQAATRGIKNPSLEILSKTSLSNKGLSSEGGQASSNGLLLSRPQSSTQKPEPNEEASVSVPVAKAIAKTAALAAASEADSSEACLTKEQKLKAERLKRAKMFAAMIRSGAPTLKAETSRGLSVEPPQSGVSESGAGAVTLAGMEREGSSVPVDVGVPDKNEGPEKKERDDDHNERRSKRRYRSRFKRDTEDKEEEEEEEEELKKGDEEAEEESDHKRSRRKRRSHHSSHRSKDRHKHRKRHSSSKSRDSRHRRKHNTSDDEHQHSHYNKYNSTSDEERPHSRGQHRHESSSDNEHRDTRHRHKHKHSTREGRRHRDDSSCDNADDRKHRSRSAKRRKRSHSEREVDLEEGEIFTKSDQSKASEGDGVSREASEELSKSYQDRDSSQPSDTTRVSDDLRAKIRAMLMATL